MRPVAPDPVASDERQATGRERHDQKITVYLSADELLDIEQARLALRRYGLVIDRGRLVREAIAILLADLDARGKDSLVARRVRASADTGVDATVPDLTAVERVGRNGTAPNGTAPNGIMPNGTAPNGSAAHVPPLAGEAGTAGEAMADDADADASPLPS